MATLLLAAQVGVAQTVRVSVASDGRETAVPSFDPHVSGDGRFVVFTSDAVDLVPDDGNGVSDVFLRDLVSGATERVSVGDSEVEGDQASFGGAISADGRFVLFTSLATNLVASDGNNTLDVFLRDRDAGSTTRISVDSDGNEAVLGGGQGALSSDGTVAAFVSKSSDLVPGDLNGKDDVFVKDLGTGATERVSVTTDGAEGDEQSFRPALSSDGSRVAFESFARLAPPASGGSRQIFLRDRLAGTTALVSIRPDGKQADAECFEPSIRGDGEVVVFHSQARFLVPDDENLTGDVFARDIAAATTFRVSVDSAGLEADGGSDGGEISSDGRFVAFHSHATNLVADDVNFSADVFVKDLVTGRVRRVSIDSSGDPANFDSFAPSLSGHGETVAFESVATDLVGDDTNGVVDVFAWLRCSILAALEDYGSGHPGETGIPGFSASRAPAIGTTLTLFASNSSSRWTVGFLLLGTQRADIGLDSGATLLTIPLLIHPFVLTGSGWTADFDLPDDSRLCGLVVDTQVIEIDAAAIGGLSFSAGLEFLIGEEE